MLSLRMPDWKRLRRHPNKRTEEMVQITDCDKFKGFFQYRTTCILRAWSFFLFAKRLRTESAEVRTGPL